MIVAILFAYFGYKKANETGRNGILWAFIALAAFIGTQLLIDLIIGSVILAGTISFGWSDSLLTDYELLLNIVGIVTGIGSGMLVLKYLGKTPKTETYVEPPPPPKFDGN